MITISVFKLSYHWQHTNQSKRTQKYQVPRTATRPPRHSRIKFDSVISDDVIRHKNHEVLYFQLINTRKFYLTKYFFGLYCYLFIEFLRRNITADWNKYRLLCFGDPIVHHGFNTLGCSPVADPPHRLRSLHRPR
jgi:hypothetical protein